MRYFSPLMANFANVVISSLFRYSKTDKTAFLIKIPIKLATQKKGWQAFITYPAFFLAIIYD